MSLMPRSYIEIDGLKIEGDSRNILVYVIAVRKALVKLQELGEYDRWVKVTGTIDADRDGTRIESARHAQFVRLRGDSSVNYQIVEDNFSSELFNTGDIGGPENAFLDEFGGMGESDNAED